MFEREPGQVSCEIETVMDRALMALNPDQLERLRQIKQTKEQNNDG